MAIIEGTGIVAAGKEARAKALAKSKQVTSDKKIAAEYKVDPFDKILRDIERAGRRLGEQKSTGAEKNTGRGMGDVFDPSKDFRVQKPNFFSPGGGIYDSRNEVKIASSDLSNFEASGFSDDEGGSDTSTFGTSFTDQASANIADASIYKQKEDNIYRPTDNIYDSLKEFKFPKIEKDKPTTFTDSSGDVYTKKPYTESTPGFKVYGGTDAKLIRKRDDDANFSQPYSDVSNKEAFMKERNAYLKDTGAYSGMISTEKKKPIRGFGDALGAALGLNDREYTTKTDKFLEASANQDYKEFRKEMRDKVFSESPYGKEVEKTYYYKDFQQPGVYRSEKEVESYIKDRGAFLTGMPSNFQGGVSGVGKKTDDFSKDPRYQSTAGTFAKENEKKEPSTLQKVGNFLGDVTNKALGIQTAEASQIGGPLPSGTETPTTGDTSFSAYVRGGGAGQERGTTTPTAAPKQTVASLPSNYKQTEAAAFAAASAFQQAKKNPNVKAGVDSKGQVSIKPANNTAKAKAQAAAFNRKASGKSISSVKAANKAKMKASAAARQAAFKKTGKSTASARKAAAKASVKAKAKARHKAFKKKRKKKSKKGKK